MIEVSFDPIRRKKYFGKNLSEGQFFKRVVKRTRTNEVEICQPWCTIFLTQVPILVSFVNFPHVCLIGFAPKIWQFVFTGLNFN